MDLTSEFDSEGKIARIKFRKVNTMSTVHDSRFYTEFSNVNLGVGVLRFGGQLSAAMDDSADRGIYVRGDSLKYWNGSSETDITTGGSGVSTWDGLYDLDKSMTIDSTTVTFALTHATNNGLTLTGDAGSAGDVLQFNNAGSGADIDGTSSTWSVSKAGSAVFTALVLGDDETITFGATSDASISWVNASSFLDFEGATNFDGDMILEAAHTLTISGAGGATKFTMTAGDAVLSDGSLAITDADNATSFALVNATVTTADTATITAAGSTTGHVLRVTADAETEGSILYVDNGGASLTTGYYINCNDDGVADFSVGADGATKIVTAVATTDALHITGVQTSQDMVTFDNTAGVIADDKAVLLLDAGGAVASGGNILRIAPTGTPNAAAIGVEFVGASKVLTAVYVDADPTASDVMTVNGGGALTNDNGVLVVMSDGALATGGNTFRVETAGTPASGAIYSEFNFTGITDTNENVGVKIDAGGKKVQALHVDGDPIATDMAYMHSDAVIADNMAVLKVHSAGAIASGANTFRVETDGTPASGAIYAEFDFTGITDTNENIGVMIDAGGKKVVGLKVDADPVAGSAVYFTSGAALAADKATLEVVAVPTTNNADSAVVRIEQTHTAGGANILHMVQLDIDKPFFGFETTIGVGSAVEAVGAKVLTTTHFVMVDLEGVGARYFPIGTIA